MTSHSTDHSSNNMETATTNQFHPHQIHPHSHHQNLTTRLNIDPGLFEMLFRGTVGNLQAYQISIHQRKKNLHLTLMPLNFPKFNY